MAAVCDDGSQDKGPIETTRMRDSPAQPKGITLDLVDCLHFVCSVVGFSWWAARVVLVFGLLRSIDVNKRVGSRYPVWSLETRDAR